MTTTAAHVTIPIRAVNESNAREHPQARARRVRRERETVRLVWHSAEGRALREVATRDRLRVMLVRIGRRLMDTDGVCSSMKHFRDEVAACLGVDDAPGSRIVWAYAQETDPVRYAVRIELEEVRT